MFNPLSIPDIQSNSFLLQCMSGFSLVCGQIALWATEMQMKGLDMNLNCTRESINILKVTKQIIWCNAHSSTGKI